MPIFNNIMLTADDVEVPPKPHEDGGPFEVRVDAEVTPRRGSVLVHEVRLFHGPKVMLTPEGKDEVRRQVHLRHQERTARGKGRSMDELALDSSVEEGMHG